VPHLVRTLNLDPPWRQPRGKSMFFYVDSHTNATQIGRLLWEIYIGFSPGLPPGWQGDTRWACSHRRRAGTSLDVACVPGSGYGIQDARRRVRPHPKSLFSLAPSGDVECVPRPECDFSGAGRSVSDPGFTFMARVQDGGFRVQGLHFTVCTV
jgi:hypothetical protein